MRYDFQRAFGGIAGRKMQADETGEPNRPLFPPVPKRKKAPMEERIQVSQREIRKEAEKILIGLGIPEEDAVSVTDILLDAEMRGVESHELMNLKTYAEKIRKGLVEPDPKIIISKNGAIARVDGGNAWGRS